MTNEEAEALMSDPAMAGKRHPISAEELRGLIVALATKRDGADFAGHDAAFFWNPDGKDGPEAVVVRIQKKS
jgi:hypothetical protein